MNSIKVNLVYFPIFSIIRVSFQLFGKGFLSFKIVLTPRIVWARNVNVPDNVCS